MVRISARERYMTDPQFHNLVDLMTAHILNSDFTPSEMREAAILASIKYEQMNIHRGCYTLTRELEQALDTVDRLARLASGEAAKEPR